MRNSILDRHHLAQDVIRILTELQEVKSVELIGSLAGNGTDRFSDVDLIVSADSLSDFSLVESITEKLCTCFPILFFDWAKSLLPAKRVISFYLDQVSIFWNVDIDFAVPGDLREITREGLSGYTIEHGLKLWCLTHKYIYYRKSVIPEKAVRRLYKRFLSEEPPPEHTIISAMEDILGYLSNHLSDRFDWFLDECRNELLAVQSNR